MILILLFINFLPDSEKGTLTLTFDDGYETNYDLVFPLMKQSNYTGTAYIIANWTGFFEYKKLMTFSQALEMQENGWEIASHTFNHLNLNNLSKQEIEKQLIESKSILESKGFEITSIAFPYGILIMKF